MRGLALATKHVAHDQARLRSLLGPLEADFHVFPFDPDRKLASALRLLRTIHRDRPAIVVMEGTSVAGGAPLLLARALLGTRYVVVGGDAIGPFIAAHRHALGVPAWVYEYLLMRFCAGFVGWTPYLVGRALTLGAPRAITAPGWAAHESRPEGRRNVRDRLGIADDTIVFGIVGSLNWTERVEYTYGAELVRALRRTSRQDILVLIVGDGSGLGHLEEMAGVELGTRVRLVGRVPREEVPDYLQAFDVASLPQSCDQVGSFRYTTKLPEYLTAQLPIVTGQLPVAYDLILASSWILPGTAPWDEEYVDALGRLMSTITADDVVQHRPTGDADASDSFVLETQQHRVVRFLRDLIAAT
jgi:hypothetical protein